MIRKIKDKIRNFIYCPKCVGLERKLRRSKKKILLIGTPVHKNLGDHLLAYNEILYLKTIYSDYTVIEIPTDVFFEKEDAIVKSVSLDSLIFITGGGWMGDVWPDDEYRMQRIISDFKNNKVVVFPQTVFYNQSNSPIIADACDVYGRCKNLTLCFREESSYRFAIEKFASCTKNIILAPDMGLLFNQKSYMKSGNKTIGICLREDREKIVDDSFKEELKNFLLENGYNIREFSTINKRAVPVWNRKHKLTRLIKRINSYDYVITDRLHGMIFSVIAGTRCIAFDNSTHKVEGVYESWLEDNENLVLLKKYDLNLVLESIDKLQKISDNMAWKLALEKGVESLSTIIREVNK